VSVLLQDGTGSGVLAKVTADNRLRTDGVSEGPLEHASEKGDAAYFYSTYSASTGEEVISIKNGEADKSLRITRIIFGCDANCRFDVFEVTSGTAAGTTLTYQNPNLDSGTVHSGTFFGNASVTGSLSGNILSSIFCLANTTTQVFIEGSLQLSNGDEIAITVTGSSPVVYLSVP